MSGLHELARAVGIEVDWEDASGQRKRVSDDALARVLAALGYPAESEAEIAEGLARYRHADATLSFVSGDAGDPVELPAELAGQRAEIVLEGGETIERQIDSDATLGEIGEIGYHRLSVAGLAGRELTLAIAPARCFASEDAAPGRRLWGPAVQLPSLRGKRGEPFGDFGLLADAARAFAGRGADLMAISPVHALFPADASRYSPYAPSSRTFLNVLFAAAPSPVESPDESPAESPAGSTEQGSDENLIDWSRAIPQRVAALRAQFEARDRQTDAAFAAWRAEQGEQLENQALYDALHAHFLERQAYGWQEWPEQFQDPSSAEVRRFADDNSGEVSFHAFAQWRAAQDLDAAQRAGREGGMAIGLIADLAVGLDPGGAQGWSMRGELLEGLSVGAPPDLLGPQGQDWGLTSFSPDGLRRSGFAGFIAMVRATLRHAGGLRIDHILGLNRLWVIPHGSPSAEGAYLTYPLDDLLRILAIESQRARAIVIGEDLGTVPDGLRPRLRARGISGMRVLWFEREKDGRYIPPHAWDKSAVAMTGTHDIFTIAGWWTGRDIDWNRRLGRGDPAKDEAGERTERERERAVLWQALCDTGAAQGERPSEADPAPVVDAACRQVASTPCPIAIFPLEDLAGLDEQPNLPGTTDEHPNWRRRMPGPVAELLTRPDVAARIDLIEKTR